MTLEQLQNPGYVNSLPYIVRNAPKIEAQRTIDELKALNPSHPMIATLEEIISKKN